MASAIRTRLCEPAPLSLMRPRRAVPLTPPSLTPAFLQNAAKSCICHTSEKSPVTPIIATDPKTRSCKSCVCHTCDPSPLLHFIPFSFNSWRHHTANLPLCFQAVARCSPRNPFLFMLLHGRPGVVGGKPRRPPRPGANHHAGGTSSIHAFEPPVASQIARCLPSCEGIAQPTYGLVS